MKSIFLAVFIAIFNLCPKEIRVLAEFNEDLDYYEVLNVQPTATRANIHQQYRELSRIYNPDSNPNAAQSFFDGRLQSLVRRTDLINTYLRTTYLPLLRWAYDVLSDQQMRQKYNTWRKKTKTDKNLYDVEEYINTVAREINRIQRDNDSSIPDIPSAVQEKLINETIHRKRLNITEVCREKCEAGTCTEAGVCKCTNPRKHTGYFCEEEIDPVCLPSAGGSGMFGCKNGGECVKDNFLSRCVCPLNFGGVHCESTWTCFAAGRTRGVVDQCRHGRCMEIKQNFHEGAIIGINFNKCLCNFGFTGRFCNKRLSDDNDWSCIHGDLVTNPPHFACDCHPGWQGQNCKQPCERNFYGKGCVLGCLGRHFCKHAAPCDPVDGDCPRMDDGDPCDPGWLGTACDFPSQQYVVSYFQQTSVDIIELEDKDLYYDYQKEKRELTRFMLQLLLQLDIQGEAALHTRRSNMRVETNRANDDSSSSLLGNRSLFGSRSLIRRRSLLGRGKRTQKKQTAKLREKKQALNTFELNRQARDVGFRVHKFEFTKVQPGTIGVKFNVNFPKDEKINLQVVVDDVIRSNAHKYNSTFGDNFKIDMKTITVSQVREVVIPSDASANSRHSSVLTIVGILLAIAAAAVVVMAVALIMWKYIRRNDAQKCRGRAMYHPPAIEACNTKPYKDIRTKRNQIQTS